MLLVSPKWFVFISVVFFWHKRICKKLVLAPGFTKCRHVV